MVVVIINTNHTVGIFSQEDEYMHIRLKKKEMD